MINDQFTFLDFAKIIGIIALPFSIYLNWTKIGHNVLASYTWKFDLFTASGISSVTIVNQKDRPLTILGIYAIVGDLLFTLEDFKTPLIVKGMESTTIVMESVSIYYLGSDVFTWNETGNGGAKTTILIGTPRKIIRCASYNHLEGFQIAYNLNLIMISKFKKTFNGVTYNNNAIYAVIYTYSGKQTTALIHKSGFINWNLKPNALTYPDLVNADAVRKAILSSGLDILISPFEVQDLRLRAPSFFE